MLQKNFSCWVRYAHRQGLTTRLMLTTGSPTLLLTIVLMVVHLGKKVRLV